MLKSLFILDLQLIFDIESEDVLRAVRAAYPDAIETDAPRTKDSIYIVIATESESADFRIDAIAVEGATLSVRGSGACGGADARLRSGWCVLPRAALGSAGAIELFDTIVLFLVTRSGRVPLHASAFLLGDRAIVLAGRSGAGKSTLALAAARSGVPVLSDDTVYIRVSPLTVWGLSRPIHVFAHDAPEAAGPLRLRAGRWKRAVDAPRRVGSAQSAALCVLERGASAALSPIAVAEAVQRLTAGLEAGFDHFRAELPAALAALAEGGAWRLTLSADPAEALSLLRRELSLPARDAS